MNRIGIFYQRPGGEPPRRRAHSRRATGTGPATPLLPKERGVFRRPTVEGTVLLFGRSARGAVVFELTLPVAGVGDGVVEAAWALLEAMDPQHEGER